MIKEFKMNNENKAENVEKVTNIIQFMAAAPGPQKPYLMILTGHAGMAGNLADIIEKVHNKELNINEAIDVIQDVVIISSAVAFFAGYAGYQVLLAGTVIAIINYLDRNDWNYDKVMSDLQKNANIVWEMLPEHTKNTIRDISYFLNPFDPNWEGKDPAWLENFKGNLLDFKDFIGDLLGANTTIQIYDPLALDLNGDGKIGISPAPNGGAYFDHNGDGVSHRSSWISKEDVILAYDRNGNGKIDGGGELLENLVA